MTRTKLIKTPNGNALVLPKKFAHRLQLQVGQSVGVQLIEEAGLILLFPAPSRASVQIIRKTSALRSAHKRPRYDQIFDSAREIISATTPFTSTTIQPEALQSLREIPSLA